MQCHGNLLHCLWLYKTRQSCACKLLACRVRAEAKLPSVHAMEAASFAVPPAYVSHSSQAPDQALDTCIAVSGGVEGGSGEQAPVTHKLWQVMLMLPVPQWTLSSLLSETKVHLLRQAPAVAAVKACLTALSLHQFLQPHRSIFLGCITAAQQPLDCPLW